MTVAAPADDDVGRGFHRQPSQSGSDVERLGAGLGIQQLGQLGDGTTIDRLTPVLVSGLGPGSGVVAISADFDHSLALRSDGSVLAWGNNDLGELGNEPPWGR